MALHVKICGVTRERDAVFAALSGASSIGLNFVQGSKRQLTPERAREIMRAVRAAPGLDAEQKARCQAVEWVGVVADEDPAALEQLQRALGLDWLQLHGDERPELLQRLSVSAYKAVRIADAADVAAARRFSGQRLLVDARVGTQLGGTGHTFDWQLVGDLAKQRRLILAGGLNPDNVDTAVRQVAPWGVDVASGVESAPGVKDPERIVRFISAARAAAETALPERSLGT
jgi:phosphoribosylanthranilate isomerase